MHNRLSSVRRAPAALKAGCLHIFPLSNLKKKTMACMESNSMSVLKVGSNPHQLEQCGDGASRPEGSVAGRLGRTPLLLRRCHNVQHRFRGALSHQLVLGLQQPHKDGHRACRCNCLCSRTRLYIVDDMVHGSILLSSPWQQLSLSLSWMCLKTTWGLVDGVRVDILVLYRLSILISRSKVSQCFHISSMTTHIQENILIV